MRTLLRTTILASLSLIGASLISLPASAISVGAGAGTTVGGTTSAGGADTSVGTSANINTSTRRDGTGVGSASRVNANTRSGTAARINTNNNVVNDVDLGVRNRTELRGIPEPADGISRSRTGIQTGTGAVSSPGFRTDRGANLRSDVNARAEAFDNDYTVRNGERVRVGDDYWTTRADTSLGTQTGARVTGATGTTVSNPGGSPDLDMRANSTLGADVR